MGGFFLFVIVVLVVVVAKAFRSAGGSTRQERRNQTAWRFQQARERLRRPRDPGSASWAAPNVPPSVPAGPPGASPARPAPSPYAAPPVNPQQVWRTAWAPAEVAPVPATWQAPVEAARELIDDLRDDPQIRAFLPDVDTPPTEVSDPTSQALSAPPTERYVGSAALESTLDSTIESSLLGVPSDPSTTTLSTSLGGQTVELPQEIETRVLAFLSDGHEVAAVRLICDELNCGLLDAMRTVQSLA
jgi:hypothetical protein